MPDYDIIIIGAGHNALITAAYLAQAGQKVAVFESRDMVGGAVSTKEIVPGYQFDLGGSAHILIRLTPIVEELGLEKYGLEYIDIDPLFFSPNTDESEPTRVTRCLFIVTKPRQRIIWKACFRVRAKRTLNSWKIGGPSGVLLKTSS